MREILFRGKRKTNGKWIYGDYFRSKISNTELGIRVIHSITFFQNGEEYSYAIDPDTLGQYTGLIDKNGKKIFEGDIVKVTGLYPDRDGEKRIWRQIRVGEVFYYHGAFYFDKWLLCKTSEKCIEIIGNIHDNPKLLGDKPS